MYVTHDRVCDASAHVRMKVRIHSADVTAHYAYRGIWAFEQCMECLHTGGGCEGTHSLCMHALLRYAFATFLRCDLCVVVGHEFQLTLCGDA